MDADTAIGTKRDREQETAVTDEEGAAKKVKQESAANEEPDPEHCQEGEDGAHAGPKGEEANVPEVASATVEAHANASERRADEDTAPPGENGAAADDDAVPDDQGDPEPEQPDEPRQVGYKLFSTGKDAADYYRELVKKLTKNQDLNQYEFHNVLELIKMGHPEAQRKVGPGVRAIQVRRHPEQESDCFFLMRTNGSMEDCSAAKCVDALFPAHGRERAALQAKRERGRGGGGRGEGRGGRRGRGRGGDGGGRRGGRGGRGRGRRGRH